MTGGKGEMVTSMTELTVGCDSLVNDRGRPAVLLRVRFDVATFEKMLPANVALGIAEQLADAADKAIRLADRLPPTGGAS